MINNELQLLLPDYAHWLFAHNAISSCRACKHPKPSWKRRGTSTHGMTQRTQFVWRLLMKIWDLQRWLGPVKNGTHLWWFMHIDRCMSAIKINCECGCAKHSFILAAPYWNILPLCSHGLLDEICDSMHIGNHFLSSLCKFGIRMHVVRNFSKLGLWNEQPPLHIGSKFSSKILFTFYSYVYDAYLT